MNLSSNNHGLLPADSVKIFYSCFGFLVFYSNSICINVNHINYKMSMLLIKRSQSDFEIKNHNMILRQIKFLINNNVIKKYA